MPDAREDLSEDETITVSVTITKSHAERAVEQYDVARVTDAIRMSSLEVIREREMELTPEDIREQVVAAIEDVNDGCE